MDIDTLLDEPESKTLEFKSNLSSLKPILKTVVAFANTAGGTLIIGKSPEGILLGVSDVFKAEEKLANAIAENIRPSLLPEIEISSIHGKDLLVVRVAHWRGPFYLKREGIPNGVYIRLGSTSRPAGPELLAELERSQKRLSFDEQPLPDLSPDCLDLDKASLFFRGVGRDMNLEKLRSLGVLVQGANGLVPSIGGLVLFGKAEERLRLFPDARVSCARFVGNDKAEILDRYDVEGTIVDAVLEVPRFIARNTRLAAEIEEMYRRARQFFCTPIGK